MTVNDGPLRSRLIAACDEHDGYTMDDLTVMRSDPFRMDTPKHHRDAAWFAEQVGSVIADGRTTHLRGIHYVLVSNGAVKPDGEPYATPMRTGSGWAARGRRPAGSATYRSTASMTPATPTRPSSRSTGRTRW